VKAPVAIAAAALAVLAASAHGRPGPTSARRNLSSGARVAYVVDGDTIRVWIGRRERYVRLIGIATPEVYGTVECGGPAASRSMMRMLRPGQRVRLVRDPTQDSHDFYGRQLRYVIHGGRDLGRRQLRRGWARVYVFDRPFRRLGSYRRSQHRARAAGRGIWSRCVRH